MPLVWVGTDEDSLWYRPPYRPEDYRIDPNTLRGIEAWRDDHYPQAWLFEEREGPFFGWEVVGRFERDGRSWTRAGCPARTGASTSRSSPRGSEGWRSSTRRWPMTSPSTTISVVVAG